MEGAEFKLLPLLWNDNRFSLANLIDPSVADSIGVMSVVVGGGH